MALVVVELAKEFVPDCSGRQLFSCAVSRQADFSRRNSSIESVLGQASAAKILGTANLVRIPSQSDCAWPGRMKVVAFVNSQVLGPRLSSRSP
jgi:hypothetical protein